MEMLSRTEIVVVSLLFLLLVAVASRPLRGSNSFRSVLCALSLSLSLFSRGVVGVFLLLSWCS